ncbi:hypothetical protein HK098_007042 [Nowakowskiella sp. JEL0407]|nr:hypothetical protein HK098_007042 [Nowakowskiella sp. JEL0407]
MATTIISISSNFKLQFHTQQSSFESGTTVWSCGIFLARILGSLLPEYSELRKNLEEWNVELPVIKPKLRTKLADEFKGASVIDLGCGTGIVGLASVALGVRQVMLTDIPTVIDTNLLHQSLDSNLQLLYSLNPHCKIEISPLSWTLTATHELENLPLQKYDIIVGADIVYAYESTEKLAGTIGLLAGENTVVYIGYEKRDEIVWERFVGLMKEMGFVVRNVVQAVSIESVSVDEVSVGDSEERDASDESDEGESEEGKICLPHLAEEIKGTMSSHHRKSFQFHLRREAMRNGKINLEKKKGSGLKMNLKGLTECNDAVDFCKQKETRFEKNLSEETLFSNVAENEPEKKQDKTISKLPLILVPDLPSLTPIAEPQDEQSPTTTETLPDGITITRRHLIRTPGTLKSTSNHENHGKIIDTTIDENGNKVTTYESVVDGKRVVRKVIARKKLVARKKRVLRSELGDDAMSVFSNASVYTTGTSVYQESEM